MSNEAAGISGAGAPFDIKNILRFGDILEGGEPENRVLFMGRISVVELREELEDLIDFEVGRGDNEHPHIVHAVVGGEELSLVDMHVPLQHALHGFELIIALFFPLRCLRVAIHFQGEEILLVRDPAEEIIRAEEAHILDRDLGEMPAGCRVFIPRIRAAEGEVFEDLGGDAGGDERVLRIRGWEMTRLSLSAKVTASLTHWVKKQ